jgi:hypothetical protein
MKTTNFSLILLGLFMTMQIFAQPNVALNKTGTYYESNPASNVALPGSVLDGITTTLGKEFVAYVNGPYIVVNLGAKYDLSSVKFFWGATYYGKSYTVSTSPDNINWTNNITVTGNTNNTSAGDSRTFSTSPTYIQYVKLSNISSSVTTNYYIDLYEIQIFGVTTACSADGAFKKLQVCETANFNLGITVAGTVSSGSLSITGGTSYFKSGTVSLLDVTPSNIKIYKPLIVDAKIEAEEMEVKTIAATNLTVKMDNLADFVFKPGYKLISLAEVENYINENKHLPNMPSAEKVKTSGMNVAEMNNLLLRKVEELTLYVIELKKENEAIKSEINDITKKQK